MSNKILKRLAIAFVFVLILPFCCYVVLKGFYNARYYQRYIETPIYAWNQMKALEIADLPSNAAIESDLNSKIIEWVANKNNINWIIRLFRFREINIKEQENLPLLCDLQRYRKKNIMKDGYFDSIFDPSSLTEELKDIKQRYVDILELSWQQVLNLHCELR